MIFDKLFKKEESNDKSTETNHVHTIDYYAEGKSQFEAGNYTLAMEYFQAAIEENPKNERAHLLLGKAYFNANKEELAKKTFFTLLSINPNHNEALAEIQKLSFSSNTSRKSINLVDINADEDDPIIRVVPPDENGTYYWMTEQLSGNKLFFLDYSFVSESECVLVYPEEDSWHGFEEPKGLLVIPEEVPMYGSNRRVTMIDACVFSENKKIKRVVIPDSVRSIGHQAFRDTKISKITLPKQLEYIGDEAFARTKISELVFPPHLKEIGTFAFMDTPIRQVILPNTVRTIGHFCFGGCILEKIYLNDGIVSIGYLAFNNSIISEVDVPKSVESIGSTMFSSLTKVRLHCKPPEI